MSCINIFQNKPCFSRVCSTSLLKTLWETEKLIVTSNFSFSHRVFYPSGELSTIFIKFEILVCTFSLEDSKICRLGKGELTDINDRVAQSIDENQTSNMEQSIKICKAIRSDCCPLLGVQS